MKTHAKVKIAKLIFNILILFGFKKKLFTKKSSINWHLDLSEGIDLSIFLFGSFQGDVVKSIFKTIIDHKSDKNSFFNEHLVHFKKTLQKLINQLLVKLEAFLPRIAEEGKRKRKCGTRNPLGALNCSNCKYPFKKGGLEYYIDYRDGTKRKI